MWNVLKRLENVLHSCLHKWNVVQNNHEGHFSELFTGFEQYAWHYSQSYLMKNLFSCPLQLFTLHVMLWFMQTAAILMHAVFQLEHKKCKITGLLYHRTVSIWTHYILKLRLFPGFTVASFNKIWSKLFPVALSLTM